MQENDMKTLPSSGMAEDILAEYMDNAQKEVDRNAVAAAREQEDLLHHLVTFKLGREEYGVEINSVQEIIRAADITKVPGAPTHVRGVINLRGKIIPVVDLRKRFGMAELEDSEEQRIIVIDMRNKRLGMLVDGVSQVIKLPGSVIEEIPEEAISVDQSYIRGVGKLDNRLIIILDLNRSLFLTEGN